MAYQHILTPYSSKEMLVAALKQRDAEAFTFLYNNYAAALYGVVYRLLKHKELAEDALQEVFVKIWDKVVDYEPAKGQLFTWMIRITSNYVVDVLRSKAYKKYKLTHGLDKEFIHTDHSYSHKFDRIGISAALLRLPEAQRNILQLFYLQGLSHTDIAQSFAVPLGTVKSRIRGAMALLKQYLKESQPMQVVSC